MSMLSRSAPAAALGEQHRIAGAGAVHLRGGLQDHPAHRRRLLAGREQLDGAHYVQFLERGTSSRAGGVRRGGGVHDGVDVAVADDLGDERIADVGADELGPPHPAQQILARRDRIDRDHVIDQRILRQTRGQITAQESAGTGDQNDLRIVDRVTGVRSVRVGRPASGTTVGIHSVSLTAGRTDYLPSFLRCTRVRRSSLRCFFFDMRLRRFLMTEPMNSAT